MERLLRRTPFIDVYQVLVSSWNEKSKLLIVALNSWSFLQKSRTVSSYNLPRFHHGLRYALQWWLFTEPVTIGYRHCLVGCDWLLSMIKTGKNEEYLRADCQHCHITVHYRKSGRDRTGRQHFLSVPGYHVDGSYRMVTTRLYNSQLVQRNQSVAIRARYSCICLRLSHKLPDFSNIHQQPPF